MRKLLVVLAVAATFAACNSGNKGEETDKVANDTTEMGEHISTDAQQSSADTNVTKIGVDQGVSDTTKRDSSK
ncbi:MAG TPA: hypothetical protein VLZ28_07705 [Daejeonella sp.]|nr:hypothetical protein [Daejeonella sp.]